MQEEWLTMIKTNFVRQPTHFQRYWFRYLMFGVTSAVTSIKFIQYAASGDLAELIAHLKFVIAEQYQERFLVPISKCAEIRSVVGAAAVSCFCNRLNSSLMCCAGLCCICCVDSSK
jgi:hypothetical protein